jgi:hypothetical protein
VRLPVKAAPPSRKRRSLKRWITPPSVSGQKPFSPGSSVTELLRSLEMLSIAVVI